MLGAGQADTHSFKSPTVLKRENSAGFFIEGYNNFIFQRISTKQVTSAMHTVKFRFNERDFTKFGNIKEILLARWKKNRNSLSFSFNITI